MAAKRQLTPEDVLTFRNVEDAQISPEGTQVAFVVGDSFKLDTKWPRSTIHVVSAFGGDPKTLTAGPRSDSLPRWSPDGRSIAFLSDRLQEGQRQVFVISCDGGEATPLTNITGAIPSPRGLNALQWSPDGRFLAFLREDPETEEEARKCAAKDDAIAFEQNPKYVRLWVVDFESDTLHCVSPDKLQIWEFGWHPASNAFAAVVSDLPFEWAWYTNRLVRFPMNGTAETLWQSRRQTALPVWSPDGTQLAFISSNWSDRGCVAGDVFVVDAHGGTARNVSEEIVASLGWMHWSKDGRELLAIGHDRGGTGLRRIDVATGKRSQVWWRQASIAEAHWPRFSTAHDGTLAIALEDANHPRDVWILREQNGSFAEKQLTHLHPEAKEIEIGETAVHQWQGAEGWDMQGLLIKPVGYQPGRCYPLVVWVHGGPTGVSSSRYWAAFGWNQLLAAAGFAVFLPNYRGSVGWGLKFAESNIGDMGGRDFEDILRGIDSLVDSGIADPQRLGIAGWSYGGYMTAWAVSQSDRFRAAVMGAGISQWLSFHGRSSLADWDAIHYDESPYQRQGRFDRFSPLSYHENLKTPTLILHGQEDQDVPVEQAHLFYRVLRDKGVPTELIVYPREEHAIRERAHLLDMSQRVLAWFRRFFGS